MIQQNVAHHEITKIVTILSKNLQIKRLIPPWTYISDFSFDQDSSIS